MGKLNALFRKKIGISQNEKITFETLDHILEKTAETIPFENLRVISNQVSDITKDYLIDKILVSNEGGLCYDLNTILYFFLAENGFNVSLFRGVIYDNAIQDWITIGRTHVTILLTRDKHTYLIDTGFGVNLPLKPVPLSGGIVSSSNGEFRVNKMDSAHGDYNLELKLKHKDKDWKIGYTFDSSRAVRGGSELNEVQNIIVKNPKSPFNKKPLIAKLTDLGSVTLTDTSFTQWIDGKIKKEEITDKEFKEIMKQYFGIEK
ncbi:arylamine N-acetyltransferase family protein [Scopulibacillus cellulosilyticus]|uniref:Arylamine N-acetyltransferase n=1 Tax=Scopulibacillus cellulosilyticus TaxID=2665665 RepID=A0ABW2PVS0_9BACL